MVFDVGWAQKWAQIGSPKYNSGSWEAARPSEMEVFYLAIVNMAGLNVIILSFGLGDTVAFTPQMVGRNKSKPKAPSCLSSAICS
jgi:hypothetical protein